MALACYLKLLGAFLAVLVATGYEGTGHIEPAERAAAQQRPPTPNEVLAFRYVLAKEWARVLRTNRTFASAIHFVTTLVVLEPGKTEPVSIRLETYEQYSRMIRQLTDEEDADREAILRLGIPRLAQTYMVVLASGCPDKWLKTGPASILQKDPSFKDPSFTIQQFYGTSEFRKFPGAIAVDSVAILMGERPLIGEMRGDTIELSAPLSACRVTLHRMS